MQIDLPDILDVSIIKTKQVTINMPVSLLINNEILNNAHYCDSLFKIKIYKKIDSKLLTSQHSSNRQGVFGLINRLKFTLAYQYSQIKNSISFVK